MSWFSLHALFLLEGTIFYPKEQHFAVFYKKTAKSMRRPVKLWLSVVENYRINLID